MVSKLEKKVQEARVQNLLDLCDVIKSVKYDNEQSVRDFYFYCLKQRNEGNFYALDRFKNWFPDRFHYMQSVLNKRSLIKRDLTILKALSKRVVFGSLTFSDSNVSVNESNMKKKAQRYLDKTMTLYEMVEEHGTKNTKRYHVHYLGILKDNLTYIDFHNGWEDISYIEAVKNKNSDIKKVSKYLCDYVVKQVPRIRRTRKFTKVIKMYNQYLKTYDVDVNEGAFKWLEILKEVSIQEELPF